MLETKMFVIHFASNYKMYNSNISNWHTIIIDVKVTFPMCCFPDRFKHQNTLSNKPDELTDKQIVTSRGLICHSLAGVNAPQENTSSLLRFLRNPKEKVCRKLEKKRTDSALNS